MHEFKLFHLDGWIKKHPRRNPGKYRGAMLAIQRALNWPLANSA